MRGNLHTQKTFALVVGAMLLPVSAIRTQTVTPPPAAPPEEILLLRDIRDSLKGRA